MVTAAKGAGVRRLVSGGGKRAPIFSSVASTAAGESCALHPVVSNHPVSRVFWPRHVRVVRTEDRSRSRERVEVRFRVVSFVSSSYVSRRYDRVTVSRMPYRRSVVPAITPRT